MRVAYLHLTLNVVLSTINDPKTNTKLKEDKQRLSPLVRN